VGYPSQISAISDETHLHQISDQLTLGFQTSLTKLVAQHVINS